jgi:hypothetical protein
MMSSNKAILDKLSEAIVELDIDSIVGLCESAIESGIQPYDIVVNGMAKGMEIVGQKYEAGEYYLAELIMAGETMKEGMTFLEPHLAASDMEKTTLHPSHLILSCTRSAEATTDDSALACRTLFALGRWTRADATLRKCRGLALLPQRPGRARV